MNNGGTCVGECDCGEGLPCGQYIWDHRNVSLQKWLTNVHVMGPSGNGGENSTGLNNPNIDGFYFDDDWTNVTAQSVVNKSCIGDPYGGVSEEAAFCTVDTGLTQQNVTDIYDGWHDTIAYAYKTVVENNGFAWQLFHPERTPDKDSCVDYLRKNAVGGAVNNTALFYHYSQTNDTQQEFMVDLAMFLLIRGDYAWIGTAWTQCHDTWIYMDWNEMLDKDYGVPKGVATEIANGVFERKWSKSTIQFDCNKYVPNITFT